MERQNIVMNEKSQQVHMYVQCFSLSFQPLEGLCSGVARSLLLAGHLLYASSRESNNTSARARSRDMSGTNMVLWPGTCPARPGLRYATGLM